jgi:hypothetical protein
MAQGARAASAAWLTFWLMAGASTASIPASSLAGPPPLTNDRLGIRTAPLLLLSRPDVRAEVGLDAAQAADADRALQELYDQAAALRGKRGAEMNDKKRAIDEAEQRWLETRLSEAQRKRLIQLDLQWEGPSALIHRPVLADHLSLTNEQRAALTEAVAVRNRRRSEGADLVECERQLFETARGLLTAQQQQQWRAMLGPLFPFTRTASAPSN